MARFVFGPDLGDVTVTGGAAGGPTGGGPTGGTAPANPALPDPAVSFVGLAKDAAGNVTGDVTFSIEAYDPKAKNQLNAIHVVLVPNGSGMPATADLAVSSAYPRSRLDTSANLSGGNVTVPKPDTVVAGQAYIGRSVLEFAQ